MARDNPHNQNHRRHRRHRQVLHAAPARAARQQQASSSARSPASLTATATAARDTRGVCMYGQHQNHRIQNQKHHRQRHSRRCTPRTRARRASAHERAAARDTGRAHARDQRPPSQTKTKSTTVGTAGAALEHRAVHQQQSSSARSPASLTATATAARDTQGMCMHGHHRNHRIQNQKHHRGRSRCCTPLQRAPRASSKRRALACVHIATATAAGDTHGVCMHGQHQNHRDQNQKHHRRHSGRCTPLQRAPRISSSSRLTPTREPQRAAQGVCMRNQRPSSQTTKPKAPPVSIAGAGAGVRLTRRMQGAGGAGDRVPGPVGRRSRRRRVAARAPDRVARQKARVTHTSSAAAEVGRRQESARRGCGGQVVLWAGGKRRQSGGAEEERVAAAALCDRRDQTLGE